MTQGRNGLAERRIRSPRALVAADAIAGNVWDYYSRLGPASYVQYVADDTNDDGLLLSFANLGYLTSLAGIEIWADGFIVEPFRIIPIGGASGGPKNAVKCKVYAIGSHSHGNHTHDIALKNGAVADAGGTRVNADTNKMGTAAATFAVAGAGANGGMVNAANLAVTTIVVNTEIAAGQDLSGVTFYARAQGQGYTKGGLVLDSQSKVGTNPYAVVVANDALTNGVTLTFSKLGYIPSLACIQTNGAVGGYRLVPTRIISIGGASGGPKNTVKFKVEAGAGHVHAHSHTLTLKDAIVADAVNDRVNAETNKIGANTGGDLTVTGAGANGGVANATGADTTTTSVGAEIAAGQNLSGVTFYATAIGRPA